MPAAFIAAWKVLEYGLYAAGLGSFIYSMYQESNDPNVNLAEKLREAQKKEVQAAARRMSAREAVETESHQALVRRNQRLLNVKQGLDRGYISPVELGIRGGGYSERDMPLIRHTAAQLGVDPEELAARFDPSRSGPYTPPSRRAATLSPLRPQSTGE